MDLRDTPEEAAFRAELRAWIETNLHATRSARGRFEETGARLEPEAATRPATPGSPGRRSTAAAARPYSHQAIFLEEMARAEAPPHLGVIGLGMAGPTIIAHGTDAQKADAPGEDPLDGGDLVPGLLRARRRLRPLGRAHERARCEDGHFVVNGQKVWSSFAHIADWCILVTRSDPESERHAGLTYLLVDMHAPGVEVRPLRQITGEAEFNEIFFTGVEVPVENVVGEVGGGWQVAMTTLLHERGTLGFALTAALEVQVRKLVALAKERGATPVQRDAIAREWIGLQARALHELPLADDADEDRASRARRARARSSGGRRRTSA